MKMMRIVMNMMRMVMTMMLMMTMKANYWVDNNTLIATAVPMAVDWKLIQNKQKILGKTNQIQKPNLQETLMTNKYSNTKR